jgi:hypothetical protein
VALSTRRDKMIYLTIIFAISSLILGAKYYKTVKDNKPLKHDLEETKNRLEAMTQLYEEADSNYNNLLTRYTSIIVEKYKILDLLKETKKNFLSVFPCPQSEASEKLATGNYQLKN